MGSDPGAAWKGLVPTVNDTLLIGLLAIPVVVAMAGLLGRLAALDDSPRVEDGDTMRST